MGYLPPLRKVAGDLDERSDGALLAACASGDRAALGALFDRFHVVVYQFAARLPKIDELARDDLVQATFLEVPRAAARFRGASSVKTWILGLATNVARHQFRSEHRRRVHHDRFSRSLDAMPAQPDAEVERRMLLTAVAAALAELPYDQQVAVILCDLEQRPGTEVARVLEIPEGTLWRRLHVARKALRAALARTANDHERHEPDRA
ncbi:MAG TPA: RNA polymerase sigma factor [Kofleriaceae bacterium]|nr:RNA polymerase sigma factor [Kofleriaceae bacterium]